jgi:exosortase A
MQAKGWLHSLFIVSFFTWFTVYFQTLGSMVNVWLGSETYSYCLFILPICLYLIYEKKEQLYFIEVKPALLLLIPLFFGQIAFLLSDLAGIGVLTHLSAYGSLVCIIGVVYGLNILKFLIFPLGYLVLSVPMGEELVPALQNITADISVFLVELVGIPVYREGLYIYIPNGTFEVAEACSGIRFLISMIAIGLLYAYLNYQSTWRRLVFVALSLIIPIIANGIRAFGIIYVGHKSDMEHAVGADHLVYGWVFFSIVLLLLMAIGKFWREDVPQNTESAVSNEDQTLQQSIPSISALAVLLSLTIITLAFKPFYENIVVGQYQQTKHESKALTYIKAKASPNFTVSFDPSFNKANHQYQAFVQHNDINLELYLAQFFSDSKDSELISWANRIYDIDKLSIIDKKKIILDSDIGSVSATLIKLVTVSGVKRNIIYWYEVGDTRTSDQLSVKKAQLLNKLSGGSGGGSIVIFSMNEQQMTDDQIKQFGESLPWL